MLTALLWAPRGGGKKYSRCNFSLLLVHTPMSPRRVCHYSQPWLFRLGRSSSSRLPTCPAQSCPCSPLSPQRGLFRLQSSMCTALSPKRAPLMNAILLRSSSKPSHHALAQIWDRNGQLSADPNAGSESQCCFPVQTLLFTGKGSWGSSFTAPSFTVLLCQVGKRKA